MEMTTFRNLLSNHMIDETANGVERCPSLTVAFVQRPATFFLELTRALLSSFHYYNYSASFTALLHTRRHDIVFAII